MYESLTKFLPELKDRKAAKHGSSRTDIQAGSSIAGLAQAIYQFGNSHLEYELDNYVELLNRNLILDLPDKADDISKLDGQVIVALLFKVVGSDHFNEKSTLSNFEADLVQKYLERLQQIDQEAVAPFEGEIRKLRLISMQGGYEPLPKVGLDSNYEQVLTISEDGTAHVVHYSQRTIFNSQGIISQEKLRLNSDVVLHIFNAIEQTFEGKMVTPNVTDVGVWGLSLVNSEGKTFRISGSLIDTVFPDLSDYIRENMAREDLYLFDGNPDRVERIEVFYDRYQTIHLSGPIPPDLVKPVWDYHEELKLDRKTETVEHSRKIFDECDVKSTYHISGAVEDFLDEISPTAFSHIEGNPEDVCTNPDRQDGYRIVITTKRERREVFGTFDKKGLPDDWEKFATSLADFLSFYSKADLLDSKLYGKVKRRKQDLIFCNVIFKDGYREYCYLADEDKYYVGDKVIVPTGSDNHETLAQIKSVEYYAKEDAPYPLDKIKHILRLADLDTDK